MDDEVRSFLEGCHTALIWIIAAICFIAVFHTTNDSLKSLFSIGFAISLIMVIRRYLRK